MDWIRGVFTLAAALAGVLVAILVVAVIALRHVPPPTTAFMLQSPVRPVQHQWIPRDQIPEVMERAVIATEDQRFHQHRGFDLEAIRQAREEHARNGRQRGASTISQQVAKNLFLRPQASYLRKAIEAGITVLIEALWSKERILEVYLNIAEFGPGIYGVEAAARHWFGKPASALTADEAARLAAVLPSPRRWTPEPPSPYVSERSGWILQQMGHRPAPTLSADGDPEIPDSEASSELQDAPEPLPWGD